MHIKKAIMVMLVAGLAASSCTTQSGTATDAKTGSNRPASEAPIEEPTSEPTEEETQDDGVLKFGQSFTYEDGLSITVSKPAPYRPSEYAAAEKRPFYRVFVVTIVNGTKSKYDPSLFSETMQSANEEADQIFDSQKGVGGAPDTSLLPGREAKFKIAFGVRDATDMVMEVSAGFEYADVIFTN